VGNQRLYVGLLLIAILVATMILLGCGPSQSVSQPSTTSSSSIDATPSTSATANVSTSASTEASAPTAVTTPTSDVRLSAAETAVLQRINQIRAGLADGTWALATWPFGPVTSDDPDIAAFLKDASTAVSALEKAIKEMPEVTRVTYVSRGDMLSLVKQIYKDYPEDVGQMEGLMRASLRVWLKDRSPSSATKIARKMEGRAGVDEVIGPSVINPLDGDGADLVDDPEYPSPSSAAQELLDEAEQRLYAPDVTVSLKASVGDAGKIQTEIAAMPQVAKVDFISLEAAKAGLANDFKNVPGVILEAQANASAGLDIWLKDVSQSESLASKLQTYPGVDEVGTAETDTAQDAEDSLELFYQRSQTTTSAATQSTAGTSGQSKLMLIDRHDPEAVLRACFSAWQKGKWEEEALYMSSTFSNMVPEPAKSLQIVDLKRLERSSSHCLYSVSFDFAPFGDPVSMEAGRYNWTYELNWDSQRESWIITNYGEG
jgi:cell division protein FtsX